MNVVVLGGGLAGLSCSYELLKSGQHQVTILEKEPHIGGMASSHKIGEYWLDHGPHRFHSYNKGIMDHLYEVMDGELVTRDRLSRIFLRGKFFDYPLKASNVLRNLPPHILLRALFDYMAIRVKNRFKPIPDDCFENWVMKRFGKTLYSMFFGTYTEKAWKMSCKEISADWASQRITLLNLWDTIKKTLFKPKNTPRTLISKFYYPEHRGIGSICEHYEKKILDMGGTIHLGTPVDEIRVDGDRVQGVTFERDGQQHELRPDILISTIPLPRMIEHVAPRAPQACYDAIDKLRYLSIVFVYLEVDRPTVSPDHWVYLPEKHLTIHRICEFKNFADTVAPEDKTVVCCEITCLHGDETWNLDLEGAAKIAEQDLVTVGLLKPGESKGLWLTRLRYAYPVYDLTYRDNLNTLLDYAKSVRNLDSTGRQGLYRYNNMDHSVAMGRTLAKRLNDKDGGDHAQVAADQEYFG